MEVDAVETLIDGLGQFALADLLDANLVVQGARLVELSEQVVELGERARVFGIGRPVASRQRSMSALEVLNDLIEIPGEGQHVGVLLGRELSVNTESGVLVGHVELVVTCILL